MIRYLQAAAMLLLAAAGTSACGEQPIAPDAAAVIALTRETSATYAVYNWNVIAIPAADQLEEWSAEFHAGNLHRVETPRDRLIADCAAHTGSRIDLTTGQISRGAAIADVACGVNANAKILSTRLLGKGDGPFGSTTKLEVRDARFVRTYEIAKNGAITAATIADDQGNPQLEGWARAVTETVPDHIFSEDSLNESAVPKKYRAPPRN